MNDMLCWNVSDSLAVSRVEHPRRLGIISNTAVSVQIYNYPVCLKREGTFMRIVPMDVVTKRREKKLLTITCWKLYICNAQCDAQNTEHYM
jgi:hypothetical protein